MLHASSGAGHMQYSSRQVRESPLKMKETECCITCLSQYDWIDIYMEVYKASVFDQIRRTLHE